MNTFFRKAAAVSLLVEGIFFIPSGDWTLMILGTTQEGEIMGMQTQIHITIKWF